MSSSSVYEKLLFIIICTRMYCESFNVKCYRQLLCNVRVELYFPCLKLCEQVGSRVSEPSERCVTWLFVRVASVFSVS